MENQNLDLDADCLSFATVAKVQGRDWPFHPDQDHLYMYILFHIHPDQDQYQYQDQDQDQDQDQNQDQDQIQKNPKKSKIKNIHTKNFTKKLNFFKLIN